MFLGGHFHDTNDSAKHQRQEQLGQNDIIGARISKVRFSPRRTCSGKAGRSRPPGALGLQEGPPYNIFPGAMGRARAAGPAAEEAENERGVSARKRNHGGDQRGNGGRGGTESLEMETKGDSGTTPGGERGRFIWPAADHRGR